jgi:hypothetical protein
MILTHPLLFNVIVVLFIALTSGWIVYVASSRTITKLRMTIARLENENEKAQKQLLVLEEQSGKRLTHPVNNTPVISLSSAARANKTS